jgi:acetylornithine deacetylase
MPTLGRLDLTRRLIGHHSVSDVSSRPIADDASNLLADAGFRIEQVVYSNKGVEKVNVIAVKGGDGQPELAFSGHLDTVPFKESEWKSDPLGLVEREGRFYGRGTCDMKGFIALAMDVGMRIPASDLRRPFGIVLTSDEEVGCVGVRRLVEGRAPIAKNIVIGEPTDLRPFIMHKGYIYITVLLRGQDGHSSEPHKGRNVIMRAVPTVVGRLTEMAESLEQIKDTRFAVPFPTLNIGVIHSGKGAAKNVIAKECTIELDVRPLPGQDVDEIVAAVRKHVAPEGSINGIEVEVRLARAPTPPFETSADALLVRELERLFGTKAGSTSFNTEGGILNRSGCTCVICGLGSIEQAHKPNEFVDARFFRDDVANQYEQLVRRFCCTPA